MATRSAFRRGLPVLASAKVHSAGSCAGEGETFRGEVFSLGGAGETEEVFCFLFLCLNLFLFLLSEEEEELESPSVSLTGVLLEWANSRAWETYVSINSANLESFSSSLRSTNSLTAEVCESNHWLRECITLPNAWSPCPFCCPLYNCYLIICYLSLVCTSSQQTGFKSTNAERLWYTIYKCRERPSWEWYIIYCEMQKHPVVSGI